jgi:hypothetical protein
MAYPNFIEYALAHCGNHKPAAESDEDDDLDKCSNCGEPNNNGEGWNGLCGNCADAAFPNDDGEEVL